jgi:hypothetical protein
MTEAEKLKLKAKARRRRKEAEGAVVSPSLGSTAADVGLSTLSSIPKGISSAIGMARDVGEDLLGGRLTYGIDRLFGYSPEEAQARLDEVKAVKSKYDTPISAPRSKDVRAGIESVTGPLYEPQTVPGQFADTTGQMVTGSALFGVGGPVARFFQGFIPGMATETAGQTARKVAPEYEGPIRVGTSLATGFLANRVTAPSSPNRVISDAMQGVTKPQMNAAMRLMEESRKQNGVPLTWPEAIQHVTGGRTTLDDVARFVENSRVGGPVMREFYADRPQRVQNAVAGQADAIDPIPGRPEVVGPNVQRAAQGALDEVTADINNTTRPLYNAAHPVRLSPQQMQAIRVNPAYDAIVGELRKDKYLGAHYRNVADDSVEMVDAVQKVMRGDAEGLKMSTQGVDRFAASEAGTVRKRMMDEAKAASPEYDAALAEQARLRGQYLEPLESGPTGRMAATADVKQQVEAIFPMNPPANSEKGVAQAITALSQKDPALAANVVGQHIDRVFAEAGQKLATGANQAGGAKFAAVISGNSQQAKNLEAAIRALPGGDSKWLGFKKLLENLEATGRRKPVGSPTDMNQAIRGDLKSGGVVGETFATAGSPGKWMTKISDTYQAWRLGKNTETLARIFTDPRAGALLSRLAMLRPGTAEYTDAVARIVLITQTPQNSVPTPNRD